MNGAVFITYNWNNLNVVKVELILNTYRLDLNL